MSRIMPYSRKRSGGFSRYQDGGSKMARYGKYLKKGKNSFFKPRSERIERMVATKDRTFKTIFTFVEELDGNAPTELLLAKSTKLTDFLGHNKYTNCFDTYRITHIQWDFTSIVPDAKMNTIPVLFTKIDYDDATAPVSGSQITSDVSCKKTSLCNGRRHVVNYKPTIANRTNVSPIGYTVAQGSKIWLDCGYPGEDYYGLKMVITNFGTEGKIKLIQRAWVEFKGKSTQVGL